MSDIESWDRALQIKTLISIDTLRLKKLKFILAKNNRFISNPFEDKKLTSDDRKRQYIKAQNSKKIVETEIKKIEANLPKLMRELRKIEREHKQSKRRSKP